MSKSGPPENTRIEKRLRAAFQQVLFLGSRDVDSSEWYARELTQIAVSEIYPAPLRKEFIAALRATNEDAKKQGWKANIGVDDLDTLLDWIDVAVRGRE